MGGPSGFLNLLKPPGMTSHDGVAIVRRLLDRPKVGHLGTLDPPAAGVLPLAVGPATRLIPWLPPARKTYRAEILFGLETDTLDTAGCVVRRAPVEGLDRPRLEAACAAFRGVVVQVPPRVSALRQGGRRAYDRARAGEDFALPAREATYFSVTVLEVRAPRALLDVDCGPGTYVRALARDLGAALGCGASLAFLLRTSSGPFPLERSVTLEELRDAVEAGTPGLHLEAPEDVFARTDLPAVVLDEPPPRGSEGPARAAGAPPAAGGVVRLLDPGGRALGLGTVASSAPLRVRMERPLEGVAP